MLQYDNYQIARRHSPQQQIERDASNRFPPLQRLCLPGKKIYFQMSVVIFHSFHIVFNVGEYGVIVSSSFITIFSYTDMLSSELKCVLLKWLPWHCCGKKKSGAGKHRLITSGGTPMREILKAQYTLKYLKK